MATSVTGVGSISSAGLGSGLDVAGIVERLMAIEQRPLELLKGQASALNTRLSNVGKLQGHFSAMRDKANALTSTTLWSSTIATSADTGAVKVSTSAGAATGNYAVKVNRLAAGQTITGNAMADSGATVGEGTLTIELGRYGAGDPAADFIAKAGSSAVSLAIGPGETSLAAIRDKINAAGAGISATLVTDASGTRLSLRSKETGAENAFRISVSETVDDGASAIGLSALAYDATGAASPMARSTVAANAEATINGIAISSASNTLSNVVDGMTLTLLKTTTGDVDVGVAEDSAAVKTAITDFVAAFNTLASFIRTQTAYNADSKSGGALQGDSATLSLQNQLRGVLNLASSASSAWSRLGDIGLSMKADGTLEASETKLGNALGNLSELRKLLATDGASAAESGFARRFKRLADAALGSDGMFESRSAGIRASVSRNGKTQAAMSERLAQTEARLRAQYSALDTKMSTLGNLSSYMTQQIAQFNKSSG